MEGGESGDYAAYDVTALQRPSLPPNHLSAQAWLFLEPFAARFARRLALSLNLSLTSPSLFVPPVQWRPSNVFVRVCLCDMFFMLYVSVLFVLFYMCVDYIFMNVVSACICMGARLSV